MPINSLVSDAAPRSIVPGNTRAEPVAWGSALRAQHLSGFPVLHYAFWTGGFVEDVDGGISPDIRRVPATVGICGVVEDPDSDTGLDCTGLLARMQNERGWIRVDHLIGPVPAEHQNGNEARKRYRDYAETLMTEAHLLALIETGMVRFRPSSVPTVPSGLVALEQSADYGSTLQKHFRDLADQASKHLSHFRVVLEKAAEFAAEYEAAAPPAPSTPKPNGAISRDDIDAIVAQKVAEELARRLPKPKRGADTPVKE